SGGGGEECVGMILSCYRNWLLQGHESAALCQPFKIHN
ncbi:MAG: hypothetical protein ACJA04_001195, partial [Cellvibrionaceae bacterium]